MKRELFFFLISGLSAVLTDFITYFLLIPHISHNSAKGLSFVAGSVVAYLMNKYLTFLKKENSSLEIFKFILLYSMTLGANVLVNHITLSIIDIKIVGFLMATGTSTVLNFIGQKFWVFK